jgi:cytochrome c556
MRITLIICASLALCLVAAKPKQHKRVKHPAVWDKTTTSVFADNAFDLIQGERPDFNRQKLVEVEGKKKENEEKVQGNGDFNRSDMMKKLEAAEQNLAECLANEKTFKSGYSKIESSSDLIIMMGKTLFYNDPDYNTEDGYLKQAEEMFTEAKKIKIFLKKNDYESASSAFSKIKKSCNACHEEFR